MRILFYRKYGFRGSIFDCYVRLLDCNCRCGGLRNTRVGKVLLTWDPLPKRPKSRNVAKGLRPFLQRQEWGRNVPNSSTLAGVMAKDMDPAWTVPTTSQNYDGGIRHDCILANRLYSIQLHKIVEIYKYQSVWGVAPTHFGWDRGHSKYDEFLDYT